MKKTVFLILLSAICCLGHPARAGFFDISEYHTYGPIAARPQNPLYLLFIHNPLERVATRLQGELGFSLETSFSNIFEYNPLAAGVGVDLDMELIRTAMGTRYGLTDHVELGLEMPFLSFSGGFLDSFVQDYHSAFGFPNGGRNRVSNGRFNYQVTRDGNILYRVDQAGFLLADMIASGKVHLRDETGVLPAVAVKGSLKLPTGSRTQGTGTNQPDFAGSLFFEKSYKRLHSYSQLGFIALGGHKNLDPILRKGGFIFGQAFEVNVTEHVSWLTQLNGQTSLFKGTGIKELNEMALDLVVGVAGELDAGYYYSPLRFEAGFAEDVLSTGPSVDFSLFFKVGMDFPMKRPKEKDHGRYHAW